MKMTPNFVTPSDFFNYWGLDLRDKLKSRDNQSNKADLFLKRVELRLMNYIDNNSFRNYEWDKLDKDSRESIQYAILEQAMYMFKNGDIALDSGYDMQKGIIAPKNALNEITICQPAIQILQNSGLLNMNITNRKRYYRGFN